MRHSHISCASPVEWVSSRIFRHGRLRGPRLANDTGTGPIPVLRAFFMDDLIGLVVLVGAGAGPITGFAVGDSSRAPLPQLTLRPEGNRSLLRGIGSLDRDFLVHRSINARYVGALNRAGVLAPGFSLATTGRG